jgi:predicted amidohydrolase
MSVLTRCLLVAASLVALALPAGAASQEKRMPGAKTDAPPRKVVVGTMCYSMFHAYPGLDARLKELSDFVDQMAAQAQRMYGVDLDLAVFPENAVTGNLDGPPEKMTFPLEGKVLDVMGAVARKHHTYIVLSMGLAEDPAKKIYTNAAVVLDRTGKPIGTYRKVHLVDSQKAQNLEGGLTPGKDFPVFDCDFGKLGIEICYDMSYDDGWEALARKGAELVVWPSQSPQTIAPRLRARTHDYFVVSSTWRNNASIFDPMGMLVAQTTKEPSVLVSKLDLTYVLMDWQPTLRNGDVMTDRFGDAAGYRYSEAEDGGIFWSNDPKMPIMKMVRELHLELSSVAVERSRQLQDKIRGGPPSMK